MRTKQSRGREKEKIATICAPLTVTSPVITAKGFLSPQYTCDGVNINPSLDIAGIPEGAKSLAIIMDDVDARVQGDLESWWGFINGNDRLLPIIEFVIIFGSHPAAVEIREDVPHSPFYDPCPGGRIIVIHGNDLLFQQII